MTLQKIEVEVPAGWKAVGYRFPKVGEYFLHRDDTPTPSVIDFKRERYLILEKEPPLPRTPTAADVNTVVEVSDDNATWHKRKLLAVLPPHILAAYVAEIEGEQEVDTWRYARVIEEVKKPGYRDVTAADVSETISVMYAGEWQDVRFIGLTKRGHIVYEIHGCLTTCLMKHARILDDGTVKVPVEGWVNVYENFIGSICKTREDAVNCGGSDSLRVVHVREVIES